MDTSDQTYERKLTKLAKWMDDHEVYFWDWFTKKPRPFHWTDFEFWPGWIDLIKECTQKMLKAGWNGEVHQIKTKFSSLRYYIGKANKKIYNIIDEYERKSAKTCEYCGKEAKRRTIKGWVVTLCEPCYSLEVSKKDK